MATETRNPPAFGSGAMFDRIAKRYDFLNRVISFGFDKGWRKKLVRGLALGPHGRVLDVASGTADIALDIVKAHPDCSVVGLDPSPGMLGVGQEKVAARQLDDRISLVVGDGQAMPFPDDSFDGCCISFGIRNVPDRALGLSEMARVTRPGGKVVVLELSEPRTGWLAPFARFHVHHVVPRLGALLSGAAEYRYLQRSIAAFPGPEDFARMMEAAGLVDIDIQRLTMGVAYLHIGTVPG